MRKKLVGLFAVAIAAIVGGVFATVPTPLVPEDWGTEVVVEVETLVGSTNLVTSPQVITQPFEARCFTCKRSNMLDQFDSRLPAGLFIIFR